MYARVIVDIASSQVDKIFDYIAPNENLVGKRVFVPFAGRNIVGWVIEQTETTSVEKSKLKPILKVMDNTPVLSQELMGLAKFVSQTYHTGLSDALRLLLPAELRTGKVQPLEITMVRLTPNATELLSTLRSNAKAQWQVVRALQEKGTCKLSTFTSSQISAVSQLVKKGIVEKYSAETYRTPISSPETVQEITLTSEQSFVLQELNSHPNTSFLLHGVTGSGKTEIYMRLLSQAVENHKTGILLVPEIGLTPQMLSGLRARFGSNVAILHSGLSAGERYDEWRKIATGKVQIVVGARSAIFAPLENIDVIIIDEEHEQSYISETNPRYVTKEVAEFRRAYHKARLVLGSATPSMETYHNAVIGKHYLLELKHRATGNPMPPIDIVDMADEVRRGNTSMFSVPLQEAMEKTLQKGEQVVLFINRRGFSSFVMCKECGWVANCPDCDVSLVYHKEDHSLKCHYCGNRFKMFTECPQCGSAHLKYGAIGTERVVEELQKLYPQARILRMDNDTTKTKNAHLHILQQFREHKADILVGTQMIAKGHNFPNVTLVGILDADISLHQSSYNATEKTFQLVTQVAGRAGRGNVQGKVILQTYAPRHYVYRFAKMYDYLGFYHKESNILENTNYPPFAKIVRILVTSTKEELAKAQTKVYYDAILKEKKAHPKQFIYLGAMRAPLSKLQNKYRYQVLMRLPNITAQQVTQQVYALIDTTPKAKDVWVFVENNPQNLS